MSTNHDFNSTFGGMKLQVEALQTNMPTLLEAYRYAVDKGFDAPTLSPRHVELIGNIGSHLNEGLEKVKKLVNDLTTKK